MKHQEKLEVFNEVKADCTWHEKQQAELKEAAMWANKAIAFEVQQ